MRADDRESIVSVAGPTFATSVPMERALIPGREPASSNAMEQGCDSAMVLAKTYAQSEIHTHWESVYRGHPIQDRFDDKVMDRILKYLKPPPNALFLDAGCGVGSHSFRIAKRGYRCIGVDLSESVVKIARENATVRGWESRTSFVCEALEDLGFADSSFDAVHCRGVLMHIPQWEKALANLYRVLKPGGRIAILEGNDKSMEMAIVLLFRKIQTRKSKMVKTEAGFEFWSEENGQPFVARVANTQRLMNELEANRGSVFKRFGHEFWDIHRFPSGVLRNTAMRFNYLYFLLGLPSFGCAGNSIIGEKRSHVEKRAVNQP